MQSILRIITASILLNAVHLSYALEPQINFESGWNSRYVAEGRDDGNGDSILYGTVAIVIDAVELGFTTIDGIGFREYNAALAYSCTLLDAVDSSIGAQWVSLESDQDDYEYFWALSRGQAGFIVGFETVYSHNQSGAFCALSIAYPLDFLEGQLSLEPHLIQGFDFGYRSDAFDGTNHLQGGLLCTWHFHEHLALNAHVNYSFAQSDVKRDGGKDLSWGGFAIAVNF